MAKRLVLWKTQVQVNHKPAQETQVYLHNTHKKIEAKQGHANGHWKIFLSNRL